MVPYISLGPQCLEQGLAFVELSFIECLLCIRLKCHWLRQKNGVIQRRAIIHSRACFSIYSFVHLENCPMLLNASHCGRLWGEQENWDPSPYSHGVPIPANGRKRKQEFWRQTSGNEVICSGESESWGKSSSYIYIHQLFPAKRLLAESHHRGIKCRWSWSPS